MVEVDTVVIGVEAVGVDVERNLTWLLVAAAQEVVIYAGAAAVNVPCALKLVCGRGAAPKESLGKSHMCLLAAGFMC